MILYKIGGFMNVVKVPRLSEGHTEMWATDPKSGLAVRLSIPYMREAEGMTKGQLRVAKLQSVKLQKFIDMGFVFDRTKLSGNPMTSSEAQVEATRLK